MQRASSSSLGLRSTSPPGQITIGNWPRIDVETVDQRLGLRVGFGIEVHARRAVAGEKAFEPELHWGFRNGRR